MALFKVCAPAAIQIKNIQNYYAKLDKIHFCIKINKNNDILAQCVVGENTYLLDLFLTSYKNTNKLAMRWTHNSYQIGTKNTVLKLLIK